MPKAKEEETKHTVDDFQQAIIELGLGLCSDAKERKVSMNQTELEQLRDIVHLYEVVKK